MIPRTSTIKELFICEPCFAVDIDIHVHIGTFGADVYDVAFPGIVCDQRLILIDLSQGDLGDGADVSLRHPRDHGVYDDFSSIHCKAFLPALESLLS